jgi:hypothetical protein
VICPFRVNIFGRNALPWPGADLRSHATTGWRDFLPRGRRHPGDRRGLPHVYQITLGTPEAAEASQQIWKFLRAGVP